ncbi:tetraacyldisaccharide 4'-kinase [Xanthovirga aplysinae]|uniref:tetraacyldisaccharide 4'-kinase n=1 Tax=Xanthovirga aplysinae TaxID=2529853 RepID=UPI0012BC3803|nr:tetraacyldisaccharide 4'-kinase [Xanthovirga aplysinae]MTI30673.1 tetraacyldisaccharide 4'-kinase [Xanthovirga aplysinae]
MGNFGWLFWPFSLIYQLITSIRNYLFDTGYSKSFEFETNVICVGNLSVGGTGKTPMVEYLVRLLKDQYQLATLSRGYGRKTKGFRLATEDESAMTIGDEPFQYFLKYGHQINVAVGEERAIAIPEILFRKADNELIILDDAFQHRTVKAGLNVLLTDFSRPFFDDHVLPWGRLRESRKGARRADVVVVTKCPQEFSQSERDYYSQSVKNYTRKNIPVFFTSLRYLKPILMRDSLGSDFSKNVVLFSGIANHQPLEEYVRKNFNMKKHIKFRDHYVYSSKDLKRIEAIFQEIQEKDKCLLTTEKDMVKLLTNELRPYVQRLPIFYLPIESYFLQNGSVFDQLILKSIKKYSV